MPAAICSIGSSRFDISQLTGAISQLPARTLQVKLIFSNGTTSQWGLGHETVQALENLITLRHTRRRPTTRFNALAL
ncbi:hypothetical protein [Leptolyngbya sp. FACHB-261]|uniref:hypothetical protein n=1 Tax=Leptolyngbya sp. FACHB-261 TaxID=2692806 RepID=UPI001681EF6D|nr:hypothetical protein [Leptolyngbya sp. FACHB-261]MBD2100329.1 hypothetical protein [Leptolyngbya sp. FACHB-261]